MMFTQWFPDPRFMHLERMLTTKCALTSWNPGNPSHGINVTTTETGGTPHFNVEMDGLPAVSRLNVVQSIDCTTELNLVWGSVGAVYDTTVGAHAPIAEFGTKTGFHIVTPFTVPPSGMVGLQWAAPQQVNEQLKIFDLSVVSDDGLAWMRENDQWWIHHALMPLQRS